MNNRSTKSLFSWTRLYYGLGVLFLILLIFVILPTYTSPESRLWPSKLGYPAILRTLGLSINVDVTRATEKSVTTIMSGTGYIRHLNEIPINIEVSGIVTALKAAPGDRVTAGSVLLSLDTGGYTSRLAKLDLNLKHASYEKAKSDYEREQGTYDKGLISLSTLQQFKLDYQQAKIAYQKAQESYEESSKSRSTSVLNKKSRTSKKTGTRLDILSPIDGIVLNTSVSVGENIVTSKNNVMTVGNELVFRAAFDQSYAGKIHKGMDATIYLDAYVGDVFKGKVTRINYTVAGSTTSDQPQQTFLVWIAIDKNELSKSKLLSGMNGYCTIKDTAKALTLPEKAIMRYSGNEGMVMVVDKKNIVQLRKVYLDVAYDGYVSILSGIKKDDVVVSSGQIGLRQGDSVRFDEK